MKSKRSYSNVRIGSAILLLLCGFAICSCGANAGVAQTNSTVVSPQSGLSLPPGTTAESLRDFESAFGALSEQRRITLLFEGVPLRQTLASDEYERLENTISGKPNLPIEALVSEIAVAYDYSAMPFGHNVFVLQKRYSDANDLPCVTYEEIVRSLTSVVSVAERLSPVPKETSDSGYPPFKFYDSLTPDQVTRGAAGLSMDDLDSSQRLLAFGAAREAVLDRRVGNLEDVLAQIKKLRDTRTLFSWVNIGKTRIFACTGPFSRNDETLAIPLSGEIANPAGGNAGLTSRPAVRSFEGRGAVSGAAVRSPGNAGEFQRAGAVDRLLAPGMLSRRLPSTLTLRELESEINQVTSSDGIQLSVDDAIADKPICLFGGQFCASRSLVRAIARLYDLAVVSGDKSTLKIGLPKPRPTSRSEDYSAEFARLSPSPLLRYAAAHTGDDYPLRPVGELNRKMFTVWSSQQSPEAWYEPANRRAVALAEPAVPVLTSPPVTVNSLGPEPERLLALMLLSRPAMGQLIQLANFAPPQFLLDSDQMTIVISRDTSQLSQTLHVEFGHRDATGVIQPESRNSYITMIPK